MPIYEFTCRACGAAFEKLVRLGGEDGVVCPNCGRPDVRKRLSAFGIGGGGNRIKASGSGCSTCTSGSCSTCH
jgi:putative FmdB family regulatory protein